MLLVQLHVVFIDSSKLNKINEGHKRKPEWKKLGSP